MDAREVPTSVNTVAVDGVPAENVELGTLKAQIQTLVGVCDQMNELRQIPPGLLSSIQSTGLDLRSDFKRLGELGDIIRSDDVQAALRRAENSLKKDRTDVMNSHPRRDSRKRHRPPLPEVATPYVNTTRAFPSIYPPATNEEQSPPVTAEGLEAYIRQFNRTHGSRLHIWRAIRDEQTVEAVRVLRFMIPDVLTAYLMVSMESSVMVEAVAVFGPREKKGPHSQSRFSVYQELSQQWMKILNGKPNFSLERMLELVCTYEGLFTEKCAGCGRVMEGYVPPIVRVWMDKNKWKAYHTTCHNNTSKVFKDSID